MHYFISGFSIKALTYLFAVIMVLSLSSSKSNHTTVIDFVDLNELSIPNESDNFRFNLKLMGAVRCATTLTIYSGGDIVHKKEFVRNVIAEYEYGDLSGDITFSIEPVQCIKHGKATVTTSK